jgi:hypothetical protein
VFVADYEPPEQSSASLFLICIILAPTFCRSSMLCHDATSFGDFADRASSSR